MARSIDSSAQENAPRKKVQPVESQVAVRGTEVEKAPDVEALVAETLQGSFGNAIVQAALDGSSVGGLGDVIAGEIAATAAGMGAMSEQGVGLMAAGNAALAKVAKSSQGSKMSESDALNALRGGGGEHLPAGIRAQMEAAFGRSFAGVRVHTDTHEAADALGAEAVAMGSHLHFAEGMYSPGSTAGKAVIAHELTHVMQAEEGRLPGLGGVSNTNMSQEQEAYANEILAHTGSIDLDSVGTDLSTNVQMSSSVDTAISTDMSASMGTELGFGSSGLGSFGMGGASLAPLSSATAAVGGATGPMEASQSAPAMLRESDAVDKEESDTEASARHEVAMGLGQGFSRAIDMSQGDRTVNVSKEGTGRKDGVFTGPSQAGHLAVEDYNKTMRDIGPDGSSKSSGADEFLIDSAQNTQTENDGHVHLDGDPKLGATPETTATGPGGDPVMGGHVGNMVSGGDKAGMHGSLGGQEQRRPAGQTVKEGPMDNDLLNAAIAGTFGQDVSKIDTKVDDSGTKDINARAFTQGNTVSFRSDINTDDLTDRDAMETVGHEMAHAAADGGTSQNAVDQEGDQAEQTADKAGKAFADYVAGGMRGPAPRLSAAVGGSAKRHRQTDEQGTEPAEVEAPRPASPASNPDRRARVNARGQGPELEIQNEAPEGQQRTTTLSASGAQFERQNTETGNSMGVGLGTDGVSLTGGNGLASGGVTIDPRGTYGANLAYGEGPRRVAVNGNITHQDTATSSDVDGTLTHVDTERRGASAGISTPNIGISGGTATTESSTVQTSGGTEEERAARAAELQEAQENGSVLDTLGAGETAGTTSSEANSLNGFVGANGFAVGVGRSDAVSTGIVANRDTEGNLSIDYNSAAISQTSGSLTYAGFGVGAEAREGTNHDVRVEVDEEALTDEGRAELESSLRSGVLPGAHNLESDEAVAASTEFRQAETRVADLQAQLDAIGPGNNRRLNRDRQRLRTQLGSANESMQSSRNTLNEEWRSANDAGAEVMPGVTVQREVEAETEGGGVSLVTPFGSANIHSEDDTVARTTEVTDDGRVVETQSRQTETDSWFSEDRRDGAAFDSEGNVTLSTTRDVVQGSETGNRIRGLEGAHDQTVLGGLGPRESRQTARGTRTDPARTFADVTVTQRLTADDIRAAGQAQNAEDGADERFASAGDRVASLYTASTEPQRRRNASMDQRLGSRIAQGGEVDGVAFDRPVGMSADQVASVYSGIESPQDLAALRESHPDNYTALQSNFARASVAGGALERPEDVVGMLSSIDDPQARARTTADVMHMLNERGDDASVRMMAEFQRLGQSNPELQASIAGGMSTSYTPPPPRTTGRRQRRRPANYSANRDVVPSTTSSVARRRRSRGSS